MKTPYETLRTRLNKLLPDLGDRPPHIGDVLRAVNSIDDHYGLKAYDFREPSIVEIVKEGRTFSSNDFHTKVKNGYTLIEEKGTDVYFNLSVPLSHPDNSEACEFIYQLIK